MSLHRLKLISEAYRNIAQAPTQGLTKTDILADLETLITKEIQDVKYPQEVSQKPPEYRELGDMPF